MGEPNRIEGAHVRFEVNRDVFSEAVSFVVKLLPQRNPQPILAGILIEASADGLSLSAFDYEASARTLIEATVDDPGTILVHGRLLSEIANRLPNAPVTVRVDDDGGILLTCGSATFTLASMPVAEYPAIPEVTGESGLVPAEDFATAIAQVAFAASRDDVTPVLTGVQLEVSGNRLSLVATDRYRVALREIPWDPAGGASEEGATALVPARTLTEVGKTFFTRGLARALARRGEDVVAVKPMETGVDPEAIADADDAEDIKAEVIRLILEQTQPAADEEQLREALWAMKVKALKQRAAEEGVDSAAIVDADDAEDIKAEVIRLILEQKR